MRFKVVFFIFLSILFVHSGKASNKNLDWPEGTFVEIAKSATQLEFNFPKDMKSHISCLRIHPQNIEHSFLFKEDLEERLKQRKNVIQKPFPLNLPGKAEYASENFCSKDAGEMLLTSKHISLRDMTFCFSQEKGFFNLKKRRQKLILESYSKNSQVKKITFIPADLSEPIWLDCEIQFGPKNSSPSVPKPLDFIKFSNAHIIIEFNETS